MNTADLGMSILIMYVMTMGSGLWLSHRDKVKNRGYSGDAYYLTIGAFIGAIAVTIFNYGEIVWNILLGR